MYQNDIENFSNFGAKFQENLAKLIFIDRAFADQIGEVLDYSYFDVSYLQSFVEMLYDYKENYKVLEKEIALGPQYGLRNNYDKMVVYPSAGRAFTGDLSKFERLGIKVDYSLNV